MESAGLSPLRILRHALMIADVFTADLYFLVERFTNLARTPQELGTLPVQNDFGESVAVGQTLSIESTAIAYEWK